VRKFFCGRRALPRPRAAWWAESGPGLGKLLGGAGMELAGNSFMPRYRQTLPIGIVDGPLPGRSQPAFNVDRFADGSHNTPAFRRARRLNCWRKSFGAHFPTDSFKTGARAEAFAASMTA